MEQITLEAQERVVFGKANRRLRKEGLVPAVMYGRGVKPQALALEAKAAERVFKEAGGSRLVSLKAGEARARKVLIQDAQRDPVKGGLTHLDFFAVKMNEVLKAEVPLRFVGESPVARDGGTLVKNLEKLEVECLPADLPEAVEVDISGLDDFEKTITLEDVKLPEGVKLLEDDLSIMVAKMEAPRTDEELAELEEPVGEAELPVQEEEPVVVSEENEGDKDRGRDKK